MREAVADPPGCAGNGARESNGLVRAIVPDKRSLSLSAAFEGRVLRATSRFARLATELVHLAIQPLGPREIPSPHDAEVGEGTSSEAHLDPTLSTNLQAGRTVLSPPADGTVNHRTNFAGFGRGWRVSDWNSDHRLINYEKYPHVTLGRSTFDDSLGTWAATSSVTDSTRAAAATFAGTKPGQVRYGFFPVAHRDDSSRRLKRRRENRSTRLFQTNTRI